MHSEHSFYMEKTLSRWVGKKFEYLHSVFLNNKFTKEEALGKLNGRFTGSEATSPESLEQLFFELRKAGALEEEINSSDARKRVYHFVKEPFEIYGLNIDEQARVTRDDLYSILKKAADLIRTSVDYEFILVLLFLKRISDNYEAEYSKAKKEALEIGLSEEEATEEAKRTEHHSYNFPEELLWDNIREDVDKLPEKLSLALKKVAELNPSFSNVFGRTDFIQFTSNKENLQLLRQLIEVFSSKKLNHVSPDVLGDAYEWICRYFAPEKAKEGEVYTPSEVIELIVKALDIKPNSSVYDPCCGSGGMLIGAFKHVKSKHGSEEVKKLFLYGQERNPKTYSLAVMNLSIHGIADPMIAQGDTLDYPRFSEDGTLKKFDYVIANPPWNGDGYDENRVKKADFWKERFTLGFANKSSADWMWIQHMLASAEEQVGVVLDNGALFRGGAEGAIREKAITLDLIEAVVLLPEKLFYNTGAPGCIIFLNHHKRKELKGKVLFINASLEFEKHPEVRRLNILGKKNIFAIVDAYSKLSEKEGFSRLVPLEELKKNGFNMNVTLYVYPKEVEEEIDIEKEWAELAALEKEEEQIKEKIQGYLEELKNDE